MLPRLQDALYIWPSKAAEYIPIRNMFCAYHQLQSRDNSMIMNSDLNP